MEKEHSPTFQFPPGFKFHPSDEELIVHYLQNKVTSSPLPASVIADIDLYKYNPWELPKKALFGDEEWYFFSPRDRKYPNGKRPNRAAGSGYWKATGTDKPILSSVGSNLGVKKALVFYTGRPPRGVKTDWMMNEYRLTDTTIESSRLKGSMRLDNWVLCRVRLKGNMLKSACEFEIHNTQKGDLASYSSKITEPCPTYINHNADMIRDCLNKDCQLLASILAGQPLPPIETVSSLSCQGSNNGNNFTSDKMTSPPCSLGTYFNPLKRKSSEENKYENLFPTNKTSNCDKRDQDLPFSKALNDNDVNFIDYYTQCQEAAYTNPSDPLNDLQEPNEFDLMGKYLQ